MRYGCRLFFFPLAKRSSNLPRGMNSQSMFHGAKCSSSTPRGMNMHSGFHGAQRSSNREASALCSTLFALRFTLCAMRHTPRTLYFLAIRFALCPMRYALCALSFLDLHFSGIDRSFSAVDTDPCPGFQGDLIDCATALFLHTNEVKSSYHTGLPKPMGYDGSVRR